MNKEYYKAVRVITTIVGRLDDCDEVIPILEGFLETGVLNVGPSFGIYTMLINISDEYLEECEDECKQTNIDDMYKYIVDVLYAHYI